MSSIPLTRHEDWTLLSNDAALDQWDRLGADPQLRLSELQRATAAFVGLGQQDVNISSALGLEYRAEFQRPVRDPASGVSVAQYSARMLFAEMPSAEERRTGLIAASIATHPAAGAAAATDDTVVRAVAQEAGAWTNAMEYALDESGDLVEADGLWDAFRRCIAGCGGPCLASLGTCLPMGALPAVVACLAATCGLCAGKCAACVACDCGWLCSVVTGCCHR